MEGRTISVEWRDCKFYSDMQEILDMATGADGGADFVRLRMFLCTCDAEGTNVPFVHQLATLIRYLRTIDTLK